MGPCKLHNGGVDLSALKTQDLENLVDSVRGALNESGAGASEVGNPAALTDGTSTPS